MSIAQFRKRYLWTLSGTFIAAIVTSGLINLIIDPYGTFRLVDISGLNRIKPNPDHDVETIKSRALRHVAPDALILGNSRAEVGIDPTHPSWKAAGYGSVYNAAVRGSSLHSARRLLNEATQRHPPKFVLLGIDFFDFPTSSHKQITPSKVTTGTWLDDTRWMLQATLTMQALLDSGTTVRRQFQHNPEQLTDLGQTPLHNYVDIARTEGYWSIFSQRALENAKGLSRKPKNLFLEGTRSSPDFDDVRQMARWAVQNNVELRLVIYPYHAQLLVMLDEVGLWRLFEEWKKEIVRILDEEAPQADARERITLTDFSGFSSRAQEPIPPKGDKKSATHWYWEAGHFKTELGNVMLEQIFSTHPLDNSSAFGVDLTHQNLEQHINSLRVNKETFRASNGDMISDVDRMIRNAKVTEAIPVLNQ